MFDRLKRAILSRERVYPGVVKHPIPSVITAEDIEKARKESAVVSADDDIDKLIPPFTKEGYKDIIAHMILTLDRSCKHPCGMCANCPDLSGCKATFVHDAIDKTGYRMSPDKFRRLRDWARDELGY